MKRWIVGTIAILSLAAVVWAQAPSPPTGLIINKYYLVVSTSGTGAGTVTGDGINCGSDCNEPYNPNASVTLTATPSSGTFSGWSGACSGTGSCIVTMSQARSVTATFTASVGSLWNAEAAAESLNAQGKLYCHRSFRATGWTEFTANDGVKSYYETNQDASDTRLCGYRWSNSGSPAKASIATSANIGAISTFTGLNGVIGMQTPIFSSGWVLTGYGINPAVPVTELVGPRWGMRFYTRVLPQANNFGRCENTKWTGISTHWTTGGSACAVTGSIALHWNAGGHDLPGFNVCTQYFNNWIRWEQYYNGTYVTNSQTLHDMYVKDLSTGVEYHVQADNWQWPSITDGDRDWIHLYRDPRTVDNGSGQQVSVSGDCRNQYQFLVVAKGLAADERIPPACELEGGC